MAAGFSLTAQSSGGGGSTILLTVETVGRSPWHSLREQESLGGRGFSRDIKLMAVKGL